MLLTLIWRGLLTFISQLFLSYMPNLDNERCLWAISVIDFLVEQVCYNKRKKHYGNCNTWVKTIDIVVGPQALCLSPHYLFTAFTTNDIYMKGCWFTNISNAVFKYIKCCIRHRYNLKKKLSFYSTEFA